MIPFVLRGLEEGRYTSFAGEEHSNFMRVLYALMKRTPRFSPLEPDSDIGRDVVAKIIAEMQSADIPLKEIERQEADLRDPKKLRAIGRTIRVSAQTSNSDAVHELLKRFSVRYVFAEKSSFVLSDLMVYRIGNGGSNGIGNPNVELWLPLSPKFAMVLLRDDEGMIPLISGIGRQKMREINSFAVRNGSQVGSNSYELLASLLNPR